MVAERMMPLTACSVSLLVILTVQGAGDNINLLVTYSSAHICALEGSPVSMTCNFTYPSYVSTVKTAFWTTQYGIAHPTDLSKDQTYVHRVSVDCGDKRSQCFLRITNLTKTDSQYQYYCWIITDHDTVKGTIGPGVSLSVTGLQVVISIKGSEVKEGDKVTLTCSTTCNLTGSFSFIWSKDGRPVEKKQIIYNQLQLHPVSYEDEGNYTCAVRSRENLLSAPLRIKVMCPSSVSSDIEDVKEGDNVTLTCSTTCTLTSSPSFTWSKDGRPVEKKQIINNQLQLHPVSYEDEGNYTCAVEGHEGLPSPPMWLKIMYSPKNTRIVSDPSGEIYEGSTVTLTCMSEADPPVHTYTWIKESGAEALKSGEEQTLTFSKISSEDSGEYLCQAANGIGQHESPLLSVQVLLVKLGHTIPIAVLVGMGGIAAVVLFCITHRLRQRKRLATESNRTSGEEKQSCGYAQCYNIYYRRPGQSKAVSHPSSKAAGGPDDGGLYFTIQPHDSTQTAGEEAEDDGHYSIIQPLSYGQTAQQADRDALYSTLQPQQQAAGSQGQG